jgi:hypothetical protein
MEKPTRRRSGRAGRAVHQKTEQGMLINDIEQTSMMPNFVPVPPLDLRQQIKSHLVEPEEGRAVMDVLWRRCAISRSTGREIVEKISRAGGLPELASTSN